MGGHNNHYHKIASKNLFFAFILSLISNFIIIFGGLLTNSVAILSDGLHDLTDTISIGIACLLEKFSQKDTNDNYTYGYHRFSILGAIITATLVIIVSLFVIFESINRIFNVVSPDVEGMFLLSLCGIIFKVISVLKLHGGKTFNEKAILYHLLADVFEWIAVLILSIILMFWNVPILDPIISICISLWLIYNLGKTLISSFRVLLQKVPQSINIDLLKKEILDIDGVVEINNIHLWSLDGLESVLTLKLKVDNLENSKDIKSNILLIIKDKNIVDVTIELY